LLLHAACWPLVLLAAVVAVRPVLLLLFKFKVQIFRKQAAQKQQLIVWQRGRALSAAGAVAACFAAEKAVTSEEGHCVE
jgi:hypothetical protein